MTELPDLCWSFAYSIGTARYSFDVLAESQADAEARVAAMAAAVCEGAICESSACGARQSEGALENT